MRIFSRALRAPRALALASTVLVGAALVAGCGSSSTPNETTSSAAAAADTVTVSHKFGETKIPADPKRVVTAG